jgi:hypothetical protein
MRRVVIAAAALVIVWVGVLGVLALRDATLSVHDEEIDPDSRFELIVHAESHGAEPFHEVTDLASAHIATCRLEVSTDITSDLEPVGDGRFRVELGPRLDETDKRQFRGCLEDWGIDHLRMDVEELRDI